MTGSGPMCGCLLAALAEQAPDPGTQPGAWLCCESHGQMAVFTGLSWSWSNQPEDIAQLPRTADCAQSGTVQD